MSKFLKILRVVYDLFLKGRTIKTPIGPVTLPQQKDGLPTGMPGGIMPLAAAPSQPPLKTLGFLIFIVFGVPIAVVLAMAGVEWKTLRDDIPGNHITATLRWAFRQQPAAIALALVVWVAFLAAIAAGLAAHAWWQ